MLITVILSLSCENNPIESIQYSYEEIGRDIIISQESTLSANKINSSQDERNEIPNGTILLFRTAEGKFGKLCIVDNTLIYSMEFKFVVFSDDGTVFTDSTSSTVVNTYTYDLDADEQGPTTGTVDFWWEHTEFHGGGQPGDPIYFAPLNGAEFAIYLS